MVAIWGAALLLPVWGLGDSKDAVSAFPIGAATALSGTIDHLLLVRAMSAARREASRAAMPEANGDLVLDRLIHEPARLAILTVLSSVDAADFVFLQKTTGFTNGNLSAHLTRLEEAGLVKIEKTFKSKKPNTRVALTRDGAQRIANHWAQLERLKSLVAQGSPSGGLDHHRASGRQRMKPARARG